MILGIDISAKHVDAIRPRQAKANREAIFEQRPMDIVVLQQKVTELSGVYRLVSRISLLA
jgi:hypothetical protein